MFLRTTSSQAQRRDSAARQSTAVRVGGHAAALDVTPATCQGRHMIWWVAPLAAAAGFAGLCVVLRDEQRQRRATRAARTSGQGQGQVQGQLQEARRGSSTAVRPPKGQAGEEAS